ncbi:MAG: Ig-like domain-containing protein, partial [Alteromonas sp.]|nr:Ig-like domain-containing protein [Alteromonas sp.]
MNLITITSPKSNGKRAVEYPTFFTDQDEKCGGSTASPLTIILSSALGHLTKLLIPLLAVITTLLVWPTAPVSAQGPVLQATEPVSNSHTALLTTPVVATYTQAMAPASVTTQTFAVHAMSTGHLSQTLGVAGNRISLTPTNSLKPGELVQVSATTGPTNITGINPASPTVWQFRAKAGLGPAVFDVVTDTFGLDNDRTQSMAYGDVDG